MNEPKDPYLEWDAAYVLGALSPAERREFESHLDDCPRCAAAVAELAGMPGLLAALPVSKAEALLASPSKGTEAPSNVLPLLARRVRKSVVRRRLATIAAGIAVAAAAVTTTVVVLPIITAAQSQPNAIALNFAAVEAQSVTVSGKVLPMSWGTQIEWRCSYIASQSQPGKTGGEPVPYQLVVVDKQGNQFIAATWDASEGTVVSPVTTVDVPLAEIAKIEVRWANTGKVAVEAKL